MNKQLKDLLFTKSGRLRVLIATSNKNIFDEYKALAKSLQQTFKNVRLQLYSMDMKEMRDIKVPKSVSSIDTLARHLAHISGIPTIVETEEVLYVDALGGAIRDSGRQRNICAVLQAAILDNPKIKRRASLNHELAICSPGHSFCFTSGCALTGTIALTPDTKKHGRKSSFYDTVLIPDGYDKPISQYIKCGKNIGWIGGAYSYQTPRSRNFLNAIHELFRWAKPF